VTFATLRIYSSSCQVVALAYPPPPPLNNISPVLHELHKWSLDVRGEQLLHLLHTGYATVSKAYSKLSICSSEVNFTKNYTLLFYMAIVLSPVSSSGSVSGPQSRRKVSVHDLREPYINKLRYIIGTYDWSHLFCADDVLQFSHYITFHYWWVHSTQICGSRSTGSRLCYPSCQDASEKRYRLRRLSKTDAANDVANKINEIIVSVRSKRCASVGKISTKELWAMVRGKGKVKHKHIYLLMVRLLIPVTLTNFLLVYPLIQITV